MSKTARKTGKIRRYGVITYTRLPQDVHAALTEEAERKTISLAAVIAQLAIAHVSSQRAAAEAQSEYKVG